MTTEPEPGLEPLLEYLKAERGFDFTGYKRSSLSRRIGKRLEAVGCPDVAAYLDYLQVHPAEYEQLFNTILINVTAFRRDAEAWDFVRDEVVPGLIAGSEPIRVWSSGCASGQEAYTAAMLLAEAMGEEAYLDRVKIYATDVDDEALDEARAAVYTDAQVESLPEHLRDRWMTRVNGRHQMRTELRRSVIFGRNDLVQDAPISRIDLLLCRNTLMYFNAETQARILSRFHFALKPAGTLFLGKSEMLITHSELFAPTSLKWRVFTLTGASVAVGQRVAAQPEWPPPGRLDGSRAPEPRLRDAVIEAGAVARLVIDHEGRLRVANHQARGLLGLTERDVGRPFQDLEISYRPIELRSPVADALRERRPVTLEPTAVGSDGRMVEVRVVPLLDGDDPIGVDLAFTDVTNLLRARQELERSKAELENSYEELQSTVEELETTNEELQSTNEELETTNEELQSTNEELETMNEELSSSNEELETINEELRQRSLELNEVNTFMETILSSLGLSVMVVDRSQRVQIWNEQSFELWGLQESEVKNEHLLGLEFGLPVEALKRSLLTVLDGTSEREDLELDAVNRRGRPVRCEVTIVPLRYGAGLTGAILLVEAA